MDGLTLLRTFIAHNAAIIQWVAVIVIGLIGFLVFRSISAKPKSSGAGVALGANTEQIEEILNRILEKTNQWDGAAAGVAAAGAAPSAEGGGAAVNSQELEAAKKELAQVKAALQEKEAQLKAAAANPGAAAAEGGGDAGGSKEHLERISELEAKLAEYEVLEDDIADLSLYKEENARLKTELDRLKGGGAAPAEEAEIPEPEESEDLVKEFAEAVGKDSDVEGPEPDPEPEAAPEPVAEAAPEPTPEPPAPEPVAEAAPAEVAPAPEGEEPPAAPVDQAEVDDLFAELASKDLDTDKVVSELSSMMGTDETASADEALQGELDPDKIAEEADELKS